MFDLFRSRDKAVRIMLGALLVMVSLSMLLYLIPSFSGLTGATDDPVVAQVGKDTITQREVQRQVQTLMKNRQVPAQLLSIYVPQIVDQMITERALSYEAKRLGFDISDAELADTIQSIGGGRFTDAATYKMFVEEQGYSVPDFEGMLRDSMLSARLEAIATKSVIVTAEEVKADFSRKNDKIKLAYIVLDEGNLKSRIKPTDEQLKTYFDQHKSAYRISEQRNATVLVVDQAKVAESLQPSDAELRAAYATNLDAYRTPERVQVRHILLTTTGKSEQDKVQVRKKAEDLLAQLKSGADFAELAKKNSQDPGSAPNGGDLGWVVRGQTVKNFENAAFSLKPKELSGIITTEYGFHIIQVMDHQDARVRSFDEVKGELATNLKKQQVNTKMQALADQAQAQLAKTPQNAEQIAQKLGLAVVTGQKLGVADPVPGLVSPQLSSAIAALQKNAVSAPVQIGNEKLAVAVCTDVLPARPAQFAEAQASVRQQFTTTEVLRLESELGAQAAAELKSGKDIQAVAKGLNVEAKTPDAFAVIGAVEGFGPATALGPDAFSKPAGGVIGPVLVASKTLVGTIVERIPGDMNQLAAQRSGIIAEIKGRKAQEATSLLEDSVRTRLIRDGKVKIHKDVINRISSSYSQS